MCKDSSFYICKSPYRLLHNLLIRDLKQIKSMKRAELSASSARLGDCGHAHTRFGFVAARRGACLVIVLHSHSRLILTTDLRGGPDPSPLSARVSEQGSGRCRESPGCGRPLGSAARWAGCEPGGSSLCFCDCSGEAGNCV